MERLIKWLDLGSKWATRFTVAAASVAALGLALHITAEVAVRNLNIGSIVGTTEIIAGFWMILVVFFSIAAAQRAKEHTDVTMLTSRLRGGMAVAAATVALVVTLVTFALIGWFGWENALQQLKVGEYEASSHLPLWPARFVVPICALTICIDVFASLARLFTPRRTKEVTA